MLGEVGGLGNSGRSEKIVGSKCSKVREDRGWQMKEVGSGQAGSV